MIENRVRLKIELSSVSIVSSDEFDAFGNVCYLRRVSVKSVLDVLMVRRHDRSGL